VNLKGRLPLSQERHDLTGLQRRQGITETGIAHSRQPCPLRQRRDSNFSGTPRNDTHGLTAQLVQFGERRRCERHNAHAVIQNGDGEVILQLGFACMHPGSRQQIKITPIEPAARILHIGHRYEGHGRCAPQPELGHALDQAQVEPGRDPVSTVGVVGPTIREVTHRHYLAVTNSSYDVQRTDLLWRLGQRRGCRAARKLGQ